MLTKFKRNALVGIVIVSTVAVTAYNSVGYNDDKHVVRVSTSVPGSIHDANRINWITEPGLYFHLPTAKVVSYTVLDVQPNYKQSLEKVYYAY
ncbi:hypothetical protein VPHD479_0236 [Vibrio phage D479]